MDKVINDFLHRNLGGYANSFNIKITGENKERFVITAENGIINVNASNYIMAFHGIYCYLKKYCNVQLSWCGNRNIVIDKLTMFSGEYSKSVLQKFRVYMNYCTLDYSMCWWNFERWEKEIDFMAMNGINMPLAVIGSEAILYETLIDFGFTKEEALSSISGPAFWAWQLMTNITGYLPPPSEKYIYERLSLGKKILKRYIEFGMYPIQQGFSGHVPVLLKKKCNVKVYMQKGWNGFAKTAQLNPLDPFFKVFGLAYLNKLKKLMGFHHYVACDPFHEGTPPKKGKKYLNAVGKAISSLYTEFDSKSVWVMQAWSMRKDIVNAVSKDKLLLLDLNSQKTAENDNMWGYPVVAGMLHNFGGKNAMQGKLKQHCSNNYAILKQNGANVVGSGLFMEGIEQNPVVYDLQFELLCTDKKIDFDLWIKNYIQRRYGKYNKHIAAAWDLMIHSCYKDFGYEENAVGSAIASRPQLIPYSTGPCCRAKVFYDEKIFEQAAKEFVLASDDFKYSDGYQYDLCDIIRQMLSNRFYTNQLDFAAAFKRKDINRLEKISENQLQLLLDTDSITSCRSEMCLSRWINDALNLASDDAEKRYFNLNARALITLWGDINSDNYLLYDYSWREWSGLIKDYYYVRWNMFYKEVMTCLKSGKHFKDKQFNTYGIRTKHLKYRFGKQLGEFEHLWCNKYEEFEAPADRDAIPLAKALFARYNN